MARPKVVDSSDLIFVLASLGVSFLVLGVVLSVVR